MVLASLIVFAVLVICQLDLRMDTNTQAKKNQAAKDS